MENRLYTKKVNAQNLFSKKKINNKKIEQKLFATWILLSYSYILTSANLNVCFPF